MTLTNERFTEILKAQGIPDELITALWQTRSEDMDETKLLRWAEPIGALVAMGDGDPEKIAKIAIRAKEKLERL